MEALMSNLSNSNGDFINAQKQIIENYKIYSAARNVSTRLEILEEDPFEPFTGIEDITDKGTIGIGAALLKYIVFKDSPITSELDIADTLAPSEGSPFDSIDDFQKDDEKLTNIIGYIRNQTIISFRQQLANRLEFLVEIAKEEEPEEAPIIPESLSYFIQFLLSASHLKYPDVMLSPSKNIRVQWQAASNRHFAVEFIENGDVRFVIFSPDPQNPEKITRLSGITSLDSLLEISQPYGVLTWSSQ